MLINRSPEPEPIEETGSEPAPEQGSLKPYTPKGARTLEERQRIARVVCDLIDAGLTQRGSMPERWKKVEELYRNDPPNTPKDELPHDRAADFHMPLIQPRVDMLVAMLNGVISTQKPIMVARMENGSERAVLQETVVDTLLRKANFHKSAVPKAAVIASTLNNVIFRCQFVAHPKGVMAGEPYSALGKPSGIYRTVGVKIDVIHPQRFVCFPAMLDDIGEMRLVGHEFYMRKQTVTERQALGIYFSDVTVTGGETPSETDLVEHDESALLATGAQGVELEDQAVRAYDVIVGLRSSVTNRGGQAEWRIDLDGGTFERLYRVTINRTEEVILDIEEYVYSRPWYFHAFLLPDYQGFWKRGGVGFNLQALQTVYNSLTNLLYDGSYSSAFNTVFGSGFPDKAERSEPGSIIEMEEGTAIQPVVGVVRFDGQWVFAMLQQIERIADMVARVSANTMGAISARQNTATEGSIIASGVQAGQEEFIGNFSSCFPELSQFIIELCRHHFTTFSAAFPELKVAKPEDLAATTIWEPNGRTPANTPQAQTAWVEKLTALYKMFGEESGLDPYELTKAVVQASELANGESIQLSKEQMEQFKQMKMLMEAMAKEKAKQEAQLAAAGFGDGGYPAGDPGMAMPPGIQGDPSAMGDPAAGLSAEMLGAGSAEGYGDPLADAGAYPTA